MTKATWQSISVHGPRSRLLCFSACVPSYIIHPCAAELNHCCSCDIHAQQKARPPPVLVSLLVLFSRRDTTAEVRLAPPDPVQPQQELSLGALSQTYHGTSRPVEPLQRRPHPPPVAGSSNLFEPRLIDANHGRLCGGRPRSAPSASCSSSCAAPAEHRQCRRIEGAAHVAAITCDGPNASVEQQTSRRLHHRRLLVARRPSRHEQQQAFGLSACVLRGRRRWQQQQWLAARSGRGDNNSTQRRGRRRRVQQVARQLSRSRHICARSRGEADRYGQSRRAGLSVLGKSPSDAAPLSKKKNCA